MTNFLSIPQNFKFGFEIEFKMLDWEEKVSEFIEFAESKLYYKNYHMTEDVTIVTDTNEYGGYDPPYYGAEIQTPIFENTIHAWDDIEKICEFIRKNGGTINERCSLHINIGVDYLGYNYEYWYNILKIISACEPEIYRYLCGENSIRNCAICGTFHNCFAMPISEKIKNGINKNYNNDSKDLNDLLCNCFYYDTIAFDNLKYNSVSFESIFQYSREKRRYVGKIKSKEFFEKNMYGMRLEFRMPNGTLDDGEIKQKLYCIYRILKAAKTITDVRMKIVDELMLRDLSKINYNNYPSVCNAKKVADILFVVQQEKDDFIRKSLKPNIEY